MSERPYLSDAEIDEICDPLTQPAAMLRHLMREGFEVREKPNGRPLISRANFDAVMMGSKGTAAAPGGPTAAPNVAAVVALFGNRKRAACA